jgi:3-hydroxyisobutyrate dehydrogenase-like beta-hydroxyacid dehydrogenase
MKMCYASITKGTSTLVAAALMAAHRYGLDEPFWTELQESQAGTWNRMNQQIARLPSDAGRWIGEMDEIAKAYAGAGLPTGFHEAAAQIYEVLTRTRQAAVKREDLDPNRGITDVIADFAAQLPSRR